MNDIVHQLLTRTDITTNAPAPPQRIVKVWDHFGGVGNGVPLPKSLIELWGSSDGLSLDAIEADLLGPNDVIDLLNSDPLENLTGRHVLPIVHDRQSNYLVLLLQKPLALRVALLPRDDAPTLLYRSFASCLKTLINASQRRETADLFFFDTDGDYPPNTPRSPEDQAAARELLAKPHVRDEWNYAVQLLDAANLDEWRQLLNAEHLVRQDARARLQKMNSPELHELLLQSEKEFEIFAKSVAVALKSAGFQVGEMRHHHLHANDLNLNLENFFHRRNIPDAMQRIVWWVQDLAAKRNPQDRPGHFAA